jgi:hypothetical protein
MKYEFITPYRLFIGSHVPNWLMRRKDVPPGAKLCYGRLAQFAGKRGYCWPKIKTLAKELGISERMTARYLKILKDKELIVSNHSDPRLRSNHYYFRLHPWMVFAKEPVIADADL